MRQYHYKIVRCALVGRKLVGKFRDRSGRRLKRNLSTFLRPMLRRPAGLPKVARRVRQGHVRKRLRKIAKKSLGVRIVLLQIRP